MGVLAGADSTMSVSGLVFKNSNSACPWNSVAVDSTTPNFEVVEQTSSNGLSSFTLKLKSSVKDTAGTYDYKIKGASVGGAEAILTGSMTITKAPEVSAPTGTVGSSQSNNN